MWSFHFSSWYFFSGIIVAYQLTVQSIIKICHPKMNDNLHGDSPLRSVASATPTGSPHSKHWEVRKCYRCTCCLQVPNLNLTSAYSTGQKYFFLFCFGLGFFSPWVLYQSQRAGVSCKVLKFRHLRMSMEKMASKCSGQVVDEKKMCYINANRCGILPFKEK